MIIYHAVVQYLVARHTHVTCHVKHVTWSSQGRMARPVVRLSVPSSPPPETLPPPRLPNLSPPECSPCRYVLLVNCLGPGRHAEMPENMQQNILEKAKTLSNDRNFTLEVRTARSQAPSFVECSEFF